MHSSFWILGRSKKCEITAENAPFHNFAEIKSSFSKKRGGELFFVFRMTKGGRRERLFANSPGVFRPFAEFSVESGSSFSACKSERTA